MFFFFKFYFDLFLALSVSAIWEHHLMFPSYMYTFFCVVSMVKFLEQSDCHGLCPILMAFNGNSN